MTKNIDNVIKGNYCIGCGGCAFISGNVMKLDKYGEYKPDFTKKNYSNPELLDKVCPVLTPELNENELAKENFDYRELNYSDKLGYFHKTYAGFVSENEIRANGTSGGFGTWIGYELKRLNLIDGIIHVKENTRSNSNDAFYKYGISTDLKALKGRSKTKYHVMELSEVLNELKLVNGKFLLIGVPCFIKAIRRIQKVDNEIKNKIRYTLSLVCGHYKTVNWSISLGWGVGISPKDMSSIQYRTKGDGIPARKYIYRAFSKMLPSYIQKDSSEVTGGKYNQGALMLPGCEFCDDVVGETADITIGDAWIPRFEADDNGTNLIITRNIELSKILQKASEERRIKLFNITEQEAINSQSGGFRQRREGLSYRLNVKSKENKWFPTKRIKPNQFKLSILRGLVYKMRSQATFNSREFFVQALIQNNYNLYYNKMNRFFRLLRIIEIISRFRGSLTTHLKIKINRFKSIK